MSCGSRTTFCLLLCGGDLEEKIRDKLEEARLVLNGRYGPEPTAIVEDKGSRMTICDEIILHLETAHRAIRDAEALSRLPAARPSLTMQFPTTWDKPQTDKEAHQCPKTQS